MAVAPIVRYMLLCDDWWLDEDNNRRMTVAGLISNIRSLEDPPYPLRYRGFCVLLVLTAGRGQGEGQIVCVFEGTGQRVFETPGRPVVFGPDPLDVVGVSFRVRDCTFPSPGRYSVQFWYDGVKVEERPLQMR